MNTRQLPHTCITDVDVPAPHHLLVQTALQTHFPALTSSGFEAPNPPLLDGPLDHLSPPDPAPDPPLLAAAALPCDVDKAACSLNSSAPTGILQDNSLPSPPQLSSRDPARGNEVLTEGRLPVGVAEAGHEPGTSGKNSELEKTIECKLTFSFTF